MLQTLPCPQSVHLGWKGLVMSHGMYTLLSSANAFHHPNNPSPAAVYTRAKPTNTTPLTRTEQATIDAAFVSQMHYFQSLQHIKHACFIVLDASIDDAFNVSNIPTIAGWPAGMETRVILDQLSQTYGQPTSAALELNCIAFHSPYSAVNAPEVLFRCIEIALRSRLWGRTPTLIDS